MFPHERSLVEAYKDRPFALLGVNSDPPDKIAELNKKENITWRSFCEGPKRDISKAWNVRGWPTLHLIDHKGVIRHKGIDRRPEVLDKLIEDLVKEAEGSTE